MTKFDWMEQVLTAVKAINNQGRGATLPEIIRFIKDRLDGLLGDRNNVSGVVRTALCKGVAKGMLSRGERGRYNMLSYRSTGGSRYNRRRHRSRSRQNRRRRATKNAPMRRRRRAAAVEGEMPSNSNNVSEERSARVTRRNGRKLQKRQEQRPAVETRSEHHVTPPPPPDVPLPTPDNEVRPGAADEDADDVNHQPYVFRDPQETEAEKDEQRSLDEDLQNIYK